ncbi:hypothetical protein ACLOJK_027344 [Asimina triloba]
MGSIYVPASIPVGHHHPLQNFNTDHHSWAAEAIFKMVGHNRKQQGKKALDGINLKRQQLQLFMQKFHALFMQFVMADQITNSSHPMIFNVEIPKRPKSDRTWQPILERKLWRPPSAE